MYDDARMRIARFFNADPDYHVAIFCKNTTEAINLVAARLQFRPEDMVLTTLMEHHPNDLPWRRVAKVIRADVLADGSLDEEDFEKKPPSITAGLNWSPSAEHLMSLVDQ